MYAYWYVRMCAYAFVCGSCSLSTRSLCFSRSSSRALSLSLLAYSRVPCRHICTCTLHDCLYINLHIVPRSLPLPVSAPQPAPVPGPVPVIVPVPLPVSVPIVIRATSISNTITSQTKMQHHLKETLHTCPNSHATSAISNQGHVSSSLSQARRRYTYHLEEALHTGSDNHAMLV